MPGIIPAWIGVGVPSALILVALIACKLHKLFRK